MFRASHILVGFSALVIAGVAGVTARCEPRSDMAYDLRKNHPGVYARWIRALPRGLRRDRFFTDFDGVSSNLWPMVVHGRPARLATACRAHACTVDQVYAIISRRERRVVGMIRRVSPEGAVRMIYVGRPDPAEKRCLEQVDRRDWPRICN
jgi:hypothetical protein